MKSFQVTAQLPEGDLSGGPREAAVNRLIVQSEKTDFEHLSSEVRLKSQLECEFVRYLLEAQERIRSGRL
jgi:hypothetical protein